jgi:ATP-binding protein involved in chromosome partitioning
MATQYGVDLIGSLPLDIAIREGVDNGRPTVAIAPDSAVAGMYREIARRIAAKLALRARDFSAKFPKIVIQNT